MTLPQILAVVAVLGLVLVVAGVALLGGLAWALIAAGALTAGSVAVLLYDPAARRS